MPDAGSLDSYLMSSCFEFTELPCWISYMPTGDGKATQKGAEGHGWRQLREP